MSKQSDLKKLRTKIIAATKEFAEASKMYNEDFREPKKKKAVEKKGCRGKEDWEDKAERIMPHLEQVCQPGRRLIELIADIPEGSLTGDDADDDDDDNEEDLEIPSLACIVLKVGNGCVEDSLAGLPVVYQGTDGSGDINVLTSAGTEVNDITIDWSELSDSLRPATIAEIDYFLSHSRLPGEIGCEVWDRVRSELL